MVMMIDDDDTDYSDDDDDEKALYDDLQLLIQQKIRNRSIRNHNGIKRSLKGL